MPPTAHPHLSAAAASARLPDGGLWVFGYGSLMWNPGVAHEALSPCRVHGYHRRFLLRSMQAWGTEARPGLCATLHPGGSVAGRALRLAAGQFEAGLAALGAREAAYLPRPVRLHMKGGAKVRALTFVFDPAHPRSAPGLGVEEQVRLLRQGQGARGSSLGYLQQVIAALREDGSRDFAAEKLLEHATITDNPPL